MGTHVRDQERRDFTMVEVREVRRRAEAAIETLLALLDDLDGDADVEQEMGWPLGTDQELTCYWCERDHYGHEGDEHDGREPPEDAESVTWTEAIDQDDGNARTGAIAGWWPSADDDEPSIGWNTPGVGWNGVDQGDPRYADAESDPAEAGIADRSGLEEQRPGWGGAMV